jgi:hypothetical protein
MSEKSRERESASVRVPGQKLEGMANSFKIEALVRVTEPINHPSILHSVPQSYFLSQEDAVVTAISYNYQPTHP